MTIVRFFCFSALCALAVSCSTSGESGGLYREDASGERQLADSKIQLDTIASFKRGTKPAVRTMLARNGVVKATVDTGRRRGEGEIPPDVYARLWKSLMADKAMELEVDPPDTGGGLYHVVRLTLGNRTGEFSGQHKTNFLGLQSESIKSRLDVVNQISRVFNKYVKTVPVITEEATPTP